MGQSITNHATKKGYLEALRIIGIYLVIFNHTGKEGFFLFSIRQQSSFYWIYMFLSILCKIAVPIFWMISGSLLLTKEETISEVLKKRELRFLIVLILFSFIQYLYGIYIKEYSWSFFVFIKALVTTNMAAAYWYLYSFAALILMIPFLRKTAINMSNNEYIYLITLNIIFLGILPIIWFLYDKGNSSIEENFSPLIATSGYIVYPLVGYFIEHRVKQQYYNRKISCLLLISSIICIGISCIMTQYHANIKGILEEHTSQTFYNLLLLIPSITMFYLVKYFFTHIPIPEWINKLIILIGSTTFGIMLLENIIREQTLIYFFNIRHALHIPYMLACLIWVMCIFFIGMLITIVLKKIPLLKKLI